MGAYDNPTIIKDMYGAEAWAAAANQVSNASVGMVKSFADAAIKRADKAEKAAEIYDLFYKDKDFDPNNYFINKTL